MSSENADNERAPHTAEALQRAPEQTHEFRTSWVGGWTAPIVVILFTIFWCLAQYWLIPNRTRDWQYGVIPYAPGQSILDTRAFPTGPAPKQVEYPSPPGRATHGM